MNLNSLSPVQEDNFHRLLDQHRAARADIRHHTRFPSLTELSDSPSIYSHSHFRLVRHTWTRVRPNLTSLFPLNMHGLLSTK